MSDRVWYLQRGPQQFGPYEWAEVVDLARTGHVERTDLVFRVGDTASRPAGSIPGLLPSAAVSRSRWLLPALGAAVALLAVVLVVMLTSRGDDDSSDTTRASATTARVTTSSAPATTPATTAATTTVADTTTTLVATTTTTVVETTTTAAATTTTLATPTVNDLLAALPGADEVSADWERGPGPVTELDPTSGMYRGACGLMDNDARALENGVVAFAGEQEYLLPSGGFFEISLYAFPTDEMAQGFLTLTDEQASACPSGLEYDIVEGDGPDQTDIFTDGYGDGFVVWHVVEYEVPGPLDPGSADERYSYSYVTQTTTNTEGIDYSVTESEFDLYERYGRIVVVAELYGAWDVVGFAGWGSATYTPTLDDDLVALDQIRDGILADLRARALIG